jgi:hypothetical protein
MKIIADNEAQADYIRERLDRIVKNIDCFYSDKQLSIDDGCFLVGVSNAVEVDKDYIGRSVEENPCPHRVSGMCTQE